MTKLTEMQNIMTSLYQCEIEPNIPDLLLGCDENDMKDCNDALVDYAKQHMFDDDSTMDSNDIDVVAQDIADRYFPKED